MSDEVEAVARAFYDVSDPDVPWDQASPEIKAFMRDDAATAIQALNDYQGTNLVEEFLVVLHSAEAQGRGTGYH